MIRKPLRPLARIIAARERGQNPDRKEAEARLARAQKRRKREHQLAQVRLVLVALMFLGGFGTIAGRMVLLATIDTPEVIAAAKAKEIRSERADILDRNGRLLATNITTTSIIAHPHKMIDREAAAEGLAQIFPDLDVNVLKRRFAPPAKFLFVKKKVSPERAQMVHDLGEPGLVLGRRQSRLYPNGNMAAHTLGGAGFGEEGMMSAEVVGRAGVEHWFDARLRDPTRTEEPLVLSLDLTIQSVVEQVLGRGMRLMNAKGASAVLMDVQTGELVSLASLPLYDPNNPPASPKKGDPAESPLFNHAAQGVYELGSTYKLFTAALALESGIATPDTLIDTKPLRWGKFPIREFDNHNYGPFLSLTNVLVKSSNVGSARLAMEFGVEAQKKMLGQLGFLAPTTLELPKAKAAQPLYPKKNWSEISAITISYGHGLSATPVHLAAAYATLTNGGLRVTPTLVRGGNADLARDRVVSEKTSRQLRAMLRKVVTDGTATLADVEGYQVGGKTGTAVKPKRTGGYYDDRVISNFAAVFPVSNPKYVIVVSLDEPQDIVAGKPKRTAGWTAAPIAAEIVRRVAPVLGLRPLDRADDTPAAKVTLAAQ